MLRLKLTYKKKKDVCIFKQTYFFSNLHQWVWFLFLISFQWLFEAGCNVTFLHLFFFGGTIITIIIISLLTTTVAAVVSISSCF
mmetsp:Transcript_17641/g.31078  ORF Transcript_17641/g.31078 Transcript_17641/m.31078 type:complete len:84 (-) Transcript_17641:170-421(-)